MRIHANHVAFLLVCAVALLAAAAAAAPATDDAPVTPPADPRVELATPNHSASTVAFVKAALLGHRGLLQQ